MRLCCLLFACAAASAGVRCTVVEAGSGQPLAGVHAQLMASRAGDRPNVVYGAMTGRDGVFSVDPIPAGSYMVTLEKPGYVGQRTRGGMPTQTISTTAGDCRLEMTGRSGISGRVLDGNGDPVRNARMRVRTPAGEYAEWMGVAPVYTNGRGEYRVSPAAGRWLISAEASSGFNADDPPEIRSDGSAELRYGPTTYPTAIDARPGGEIAGIDIRMRPWQSWRIAGTVSGLQGAARVYYMGSIPRGEMLAHTEVAADGSFSFPHLEPGTYRLIASGENGTQTAAMTIELKDSDVTGLRLVLAAPFAVDGMVETAPGETVKRIQLELVGAGADLARTFNAIRWMHEGSVAADGTFRIEGAKPGKYRIRVLPERPDSYVKAPAGVLDLQNPAGPVRLNVAIGNNGARLSGRVEGKSGPVTHGLASVHLLPEGADPQDSLLSDREPEGKYSFHGLAPGKYRLYAVDPTILDPPVDPSKTAEVIELKEGDRITRNVKVSDAP